MADTGEEYTGDKSDVHSGGSLFPQLTGTEMPDKVTSLEFFGREPSSVPTYSHLLK